ncbi:DUF559 domain-containing protein [Chryseobacterium sp. H1D6B]|uniref:endonuclease domain-containing protein n=1 Tax=Chryseobacterium sp. H1D6B TaxID=2940588 RepID=UPI0015C6C149|nr:DUF559 domain-containing protein [Chryseobacterium sp. H1D6B]
MKEKSGSSKNSKKTDIDQILTYINDVPIRRNFVDNLPSNPKLKVLLIKKRRAGILSEVLFWMQIRAKSFHKIDFERQMIIGDYIVDFYVKNLGLVIEIDGANHNKNQVEDGVEHEFLESLGLQVFRIKDADVRNKLPEVMENLEKFIVLNYKITPNPEIL